MKLDCDSHYHDKRLRPRNRQLAVDEIHRVLKPLVRVQMANINTEFPFVAAGVLLQQYPASAEAKLT